MIRPAQEQLSYRPRVVLAHRILERTLDQVGLTLPVPLPDEGRLQGRPRWLEADHGEVRLVDERGTSRIATVAFDPPDRPRTAYLEVHVIALARTPETRKRRELAADVAIGEALVADIFDLEEAP